MGLVRKCLESLPGLKHAASLVYARPVYTPRTVLALAGLGVAGLCLGTTQGRRVGREVWRLGFVDRNEEKLPPKESSKPTVFVDLEEVLLKKRFSLSSLGYVFTVREYAGAFLFHLSNTYEVVSISSLPPELGAEILQKVDPYGCITYRMFVQSKDAVRVEGTNRSAAQSVWVRSTPSACANVLSIGPWGGEEESGLLSALDFLINLQQVESEDFRPVLRTYRDRRFFQAYEEVQQRVYPSKRKWLVFQDGTEPGKSIERANMQRIEEYRAAKEYIDNQIRLAQVIKN
ncbi:mitochondrial import inner membrane translocase subunit TIM50 [Nematocida sp. AWRm77]|nr:mitochondrial import inner membrane translocase subunit TIM50 [Nematocida sp. AWRm77]